MKPYRIDRITIDPEFASLIAPLNTDELALLEAALKRDGLREFLTVWTDGGTVRLLDGHNRLRIMAAAGFEEVPVTFAKLPDRDAALLWIEENQAGRRNLTDDQRAMIWASILERRAKASHETKLEQARQTKSAPASMEVKTTSIEKIDSAADMAEALAPKQRARAEVAKESGLPESKLRAAAKLKKEDPEAAKQVRAGTKTIRQAKKARRAKKESAGKFVENVKVGDFLIVWHMGDESFVEVSSVDAHSVCIRFPNSGMREWFTRSSARRRSGRRIVRLATTEDIQKYENEKESRRKQQGALDAATELVEQIGEFNPNVTTWNSDGLHLSLSKLTVEHVRRIVAALTESAEPTAPEPEPTVLPLDEAESVGAPE